MLTMPARENDTPSNQKLKDLQVGKIRRNLICVTDYSVRTIFPLKYQRAKVALAALMELTFMCILVHYHR